ncbi:MAG: hypothetical protein NTW75_08155 [Planctomycetales bacterium]|nr:hypothetical protein [Planctomycetales bacterium]
MSPRQILLVALILGGISASKVSLSAEQSATRSAVAVSQKEPLVDALQGKPHPALNKKQKALVAVAGIAAIILVGMSLTAMTIVWAGYLRRVRRQADPTSTALNNSFWFLKPSKPRIDHSSLPEQQPPTDRQVASVPPSTENP